MANTARKVLQAYSEVCIFLCDTIYKQSVGCALKVLEKSLKTVLDEVYFIVNMYSFRLTHGPPGKSFLPSFVPLTLFQNCPSSRHISNSLSVYFFLNSEP